MHACHGAHAESAAHAFVAMPMHASASQALHCALPDSVSSRQMSAAQSVAQVPGVTQTQFAKICRYAARPVDCTPAQQPSQEEGSLAHIAFWASVPASATTSQSLKHGALVKVAAPTSKV
jgi:hypothetical protein